MFDALIILETELELGISRPGDMKYLMSLVRPKIAVITDITQRYIESFADMDELVGEYKHFVELIGKNSYLLLNYDNARIKKLAEFTKAKIIPLELENNGLLENYWLGEITEKNTNGLAVKVTTGRKTKNYQINRFGQHHRQSHA